MKSANLKRIRKKMEKTLDPKRFEHTLGVTYTAAALAMCHETDIQKAQIAGLLHDCAKCMDNEKKIAICQKHKIEINEIERQNPFLLHAKVGSYVAAKKFGISDPDILHAILYHTTGRPEMSDLEKIVYIADYIEPGRKQIPNLTEIRKLAFQDLDRALLKILDNTLNYLERSAQVIDPMTRKTYEYYLEKVK